MRARVRTEKKVSVLEGRAPRSLCLALFATLAFAGCDDDDETPSTPLDGGTTIDAAVTDTGTNIDAGAPVSTNSLYAIATGVTVGTSDTTTYIKTVPALDVDQKLDLTQSLESPQFGDAWYIGEKLFVSTPESPILKRYIINANGTFTADGEINFGTYNTTANIYEMGFVSPTKAYLSGQTKWVVWNPSTLQIIKTVDYPAAALAKRDNLNPHISYDRGFKVRGNKIYQPVSWSDVENHKMAATSLLMVIDATTDALLTTSELPCPFIDVATEDDGGNLWFSGWVYSPGATLRNGGAKSCAVKVPAGQDVIDPAATLVMADITGGHEASALTYIGDNKFLLTVFHEEKTPFVEGTMIFNWLFSDSWRYGTYDIVTKQFKELTDFGWNSGGYYSARLSGRFYLLTPGAGYKDTTYYELKPDGTAKKGLSMDGWSTRAFQIR